MRILQIAHNHPKFMPGGTELMALAMHRQALAHGHQSWFLGAVDSHVKTPNPGTQMVGLDADHRESVIWFPEFDRFELQQVDTYGGLRELRDYLQLVQPDIIHFHHFLLFGLEAFFAARIAAPHAKIVLTLHDYYLICANNGQLYKHDRKQRCHGPEIDACQTCIPSRTANDFRLRELDIFHALANVDRICAPSHFLADKMNQYLRYPEKVRFVENGCLLDQVPSSANAQRIDNDRPLVLGYFGNISSVKGLPDLLTALSILADQGETGVQLHVHGSQLYDDAPLSDAVAAGQSRLGHRMMQFGVYETAELGPALASVDAVVFPSVWWENAPLVIYEAMKAGKPVIAYPHGGAPEILARYDMGILASSSHPHALAETIKTVIHDRDLLARSPSRPIPGTDTMFGTYKIIYEELLAGTPSAST